MVGDIANHSFYNNVCKYKKNIVSLPYIVSCENRVGEKTKKASADMRRHDCDSERIRTFIVRTGILNSIH